MQPSDTQSTRTQPINAHPANASPANVSPANVSPANVSPANVSPAADSQPAGSRPVRSRPAGPQTAGSRPVRSRPARRAVFSDWLRIVCGLAVFSFGVHLTIFADIGLAPWDCLGMGISLHTPLNYGLSMTVMAVVILLIDLLMRERIGFGTIFDALLTGNIIQLFNSINPFPKNGHLVTGLVLMTAGFVFMAVGMWIYMKAAQCCGPRDSLLVGLGRRMPSVSIGLVGIILWGVVTLAGWLLGGPVGIGTLYGTFGTGIVMNLVYRAIGFEPRDIRHRDVIEVCRELRSSVI